MLDLTLTYSDINVVVLVLFLFTVIMGEWTKKYLYLIVGALIAISMTISTDDNNVRAVTVIFSAWLWLRAYGVLVEGKTR